MWLDLVYVPSICQVLLKRSCWSENLVWLLSRGCWAVVAESWLLKRSCWSVVAEAWLLKRSCWAVVAEAEFNPVSMETNFDRIQQTPSWHLHTNPVNHQTWCNPWCLSYDQLGDVGVTPLHLVLDKENPYPINANHGAGICTPTKLGDFGQGQMWVNILPAPWFAYGVWRL